MTIVMGNRRRDAVTDLQRQNQRLALENEQHDEFLDNLHGLLLEHQELDPSLSTIALDEIRQHRRKIRQTRSNRSLS